ncbi:MAG: methionyl-tRNA formyltransferase [Candidatus Hydrogenedentes bacterium]|nr:methionyl-tRNA formyltransferase [Candidatus Hydrogenedentota bacterium]
MRIAVAGGGYLASQILEAVLHSNHELVALIQDARRYRGVKRYLGPMVGAFFPKREVSGVALRKRIPIVFIDKMTEDELAPLRELKLDLILVCGFAIILKKPLLDLPAIGCVNCHSSLLPRHRGPNPFTAAILANEKETGITFHVVSEGIDTGDILKQYAFPISGTDTAGSIHRRASDLASEKMAEVLSYIEQNGLKGCPQHSENATYDKRLTPSELCIDWTCPADMIERKVRACFPFTIARTKYKGRTVYLSRVRMSSKHIEAQPGEVIENIPQLRVGTGKGVVIIEIAHTLRPIPWFWPRLLRRPQIGERLG